MQGTTFRVDMGAMAALLQNAAATAMHSAGADGGPAPLATPLPSWLSAGLTAAAAFQEETAAALAARQKHGDAAGYRLVAEGLLGHGGGGSGTGSLGGSGTASPGVWTRGSGELALL